MKQLFILIMLMIAISSHAQVRDSFAVYFPLNKNELTLTEQQRIDSLIYHDLIFPSQTLSILGYTDYLASDEYNKVLSQHRAENVKAYLVRSGFSADNIILCVGKGKIDRAPVNNKSGFPDDRKVIIAICKKTTKTITEGAMQPVQKTNSLNDYAALKVNETLILDNLYFLPSKHNIRSEALPALEQLYNVLKVHPKLKISIEGHVCCISPPTPDGYDVDNKTFDLSTRRAREIYNYLIDKGISKNRLKYIGLARTHPLIDPERNKADSDKNRRVEIRILEK